MDHLNLTNNHPPNLKSISKTHIQLQKINREIEIETETEIIDFWNTKRSN